MMEKINACDHRVMRRLPQFSLLALLVPFLCVTASAADGGLGPFAIEVPGNGAAEHCLKLAAGQSIRYRFDSTGLVDFNIHYHRGETVHLPLERKAVKILNGEFRAESTEDYCLMWEARGAGSVKINGRIEALKVAAPQ